MSVYWIGLDWIGLKGRGADEIAVRCFLGLTGAQGREERGEMEGVDGLKLRAMMR